MKNESSELVDPSEQPHGKLSHALSTSPRPSMLPRSSAPLSRDNFRTLFTLTENQPWLKERQVPLIDLMEECTQQEQQILVCELLERFTFLDGNAFQAAIQEMCDYIQNDLKLTARDCLISASDNGVHADSSQLVVYSLKSAKWNSIEWNTTSFVSRLSGLTESAAKNNLIIVDEFIGTGETAAKKVKWLKDKLAARDHSPRIYFAVVAGMKAGIDRVSACVDGIFAAHILQRGISDAYPAALVQPNIDTMKAMETKLGSVGRGGRIGKHSLGYKGSESLYSRSNGNTPNNVFPIFWWEIDSKDSPRSTILTRI